MKLSPKYERLLTQAKHKKYLKTSSRRNDTLDDAFFNWCKENKYPCIKVSIGQKYSDIDIRLDTTDLDVTSQVIETGSFPGNRDHQFHNVISSSLLSQDFSH